jgi:hypothetical protein
MDMNKQETAVIISAVKALCPAQKMAELTPDLWHAVLGDLDFNDTKTAVGNLGQRLSFISPAEIYTEVRSIRSDRINSASLVYEPLPDETTDDFLRRLAAVREAAASGQIPAGPPRLALPPGTSPAAVPLQIGRIVEQVRAERGHPALQVGCPWCGAQPGRWCEKPRPGRRKEAVRGFFHPARCKAVNVPFQAALPAAEARP